MSGGRRLAVLGIALAVMNSGCGFIGWSLSSKSEVTSYTVPRTQEVKVSSEPEGATVVVDGAEAGPTPRKVKVAITELRQRREQSKIPGIIGMALDLGFGAVATAACISTNSTECAAAAFGIGLTLVLLDTYLIFGKTVSNESSDVLPAAFDIGIWHPGYLEQTRRIRVPDLTEVHFRLMPLRDPAPADSQPPPDTAPDAPLRQP